MKNSMQNLAKNNLDKAGSAGKRAMLPLPSPLPALAILLPLLGVSPPTHAATMNPPQRQKFQSYASGKIRAVFHTLNHSDNFTAARQSLDNLFETVIGYDHTTHLQVIRRADFARRLVNQLANVKNSNKRRTLLRWLLANHALAGTLVFLVKPHQQNIAAVYNLLYRMHKELGQEAAAYPNLTAAICAVLYRPLVMHINENTARSPDPVALFKYYVKYQREMLFGIRHVPARLLIHVVDSDSSIRDMKWALAEFHGDPMVGRLFFKIRYDYSTLRNISGDTVALDRHGFNLPDILRYGGVCADQAFFAAQAGKAIGAPTAYDTGRSSVVGHAWVGFLQTAGRRGWWNFNVGRYAEYQGVVGMVLNPQTRRLEPDSFLSLSAQLIGTTQRQRWNAVALTDAALRLIGMKQAGESFNPVHPPVGVYGDRRRPRTDNIQTQLKFLHRAVDQCSGLAMAWFAVGYLADKGKLTRVEKKEWSNHLLRLCGQLYPDFTLAVLAPMASSIRNVREQNLLWNRLFAMFATRQFALAARVRMFQGAMWKKAGHENRAGACYLYVINHYANAGPFVITALQKAVQILRDQKRNNLIPQLYERTWAKIVPPPRWSAVFVHESNWYQVGRMLEEELRAMGKGSLARKVARELAVAQHPLTQN